MAKNVNNQKISLTWLIPQPEDAVLHSLLSWLKGDALFGHHHSVPCILNRVEIGKFWHYDLKCGRGGWHRPPESQIGLNSFLPPTWWFCPTLLMNMMMGRCAQLGPCQAHTVLTIKYRGSLSSRPRLTALESNIEYPNKFLKRCPISWVSHVTGHSPGIFRLCEQWWKPLSPRNLRWTSS